MYYIKYVFNIVIQIISDLTEMTFNTYLKIYNYKYL